MNPHDKQHVRQAALNFLSRREYARQELATKLLGKGFAAEIIAPVLDELVQENLLSDSRFSAAYVHAYQAKGQGPLRLQQGLRQRGIEQALIDATLEEDAPDWLTEARRVKLKRFGQALPTDPKDYARQARFLVYRGFTAEQVRSVLQKHPAEDD